MNKKRSSYAHLSKYVFAMPLIVVLALIFSFSNTYHPEEVDGSTSVVILDQRLSIPVTDQEILNDELGGDESGMVLQTESEKPAKTQIRMVRVREQIKHGDTASVGKHELSMALLDEIRAKRIDAANPDKRLSLQVKKDSIFVKGELYANEREDPADREEKDIKGRITSFKITASDKTPLVLIDGVEGDLSAINPDQIKSISVLKEKSRADFTERFGQKASEGVILIETKP